MQIYSIDHIEAQVESKKLYLIGEFDNNTLINFSMMQSKGIKPGTTLYIHSNGGSLWTLLGLRDLLVIEKNIENLVGYGVIYSAAAYLFLMLPNRIKRYMTPSCEFMIHKATAASYAEHEFEHKNMYKTIEKDNAALKTLVTDAIKTLPKKEQKRIIKSWQEGEDIYFDAGECITMNIIDGVLDAINTLEE